MVDGGARVSWYLDYRIIVLTFPNVVFVIFNIPYMTYPHFLFDSQFVDSGTVILSRFPLSDARYVMFERGMYIDKTLEKGVMYCRVQLTDSFHLHVFNTHMQSDYTLHPDLPAGITRLERLYT